MSITLTHPTDGAGGTPRSLSIPPDLIWTNEFAWWQAVGEATEYTSTGALVICEWPAKQSGKPMELTGEITHGWIQLGDLKILDRWAAQPGLVMQLIRLGVSYTVRWDRVSGAIESSPVKQYSDPQDADLYTLKLRFLIL